jgi:hypothetical protein
VRARRGHDPRVVRGGGGGHGRRYVRGSHRKTRFPNTRASDDDSETAARRNKKRIRTPARVRRPATRVYFASLFQCGKEARKKKRFSFRRRRTTDETPFV